MPVAAPTHLTNFAPIVGVELSSQVLHFSQPRQGDAPLDDVFNIRFVHALDDEIGPVIFADGLMFDIERNHKYFSPALNVAGLFIPKQSQLMLKTDLTI